jgi:hypothetical protein
VSAKPGYVVKKAMPTQKPTTFVYICVRRVETDYSWQLPTSLKYYKVGRYVGRYGLKSWAFSKWAPAAWGSPWLRTCISGRPLLKGLT